MGTSEGGGAREGGGGGERRRMRDGAQSVKGRSPPVLAGAQGEIGRGGQSAPRPGTKPDVTPPSWDSRPGSSNPRPPPPSHTRLPSLHPAVWVSGPHMPHAPQGRAPCLGNPSTGPCLTPRPPPPADAFRRGTHGCRRPRAGRWASAHSCPGTRRTWRRFPGPSCALGTGSRAAGERTTCKTLGDRLRGQAA